MNGSLKRIILYCKSYSLEHTCKLHNQIHIDILIMLNHRVRSIIKNKSSTTCT